MNVSGTTFLRRGTTVICIYAMLASTLPAQTSNPAAPTPPQNPRAQTRCFFEQSSSSV